MGWHCIEGRYYYYRNFKRDGRSFREYCGDSIVGSIASLEDQEKREEKAKLKEKREQFREAERLYREYSTLLRSFTCASLVNAGFREHKWEWHRRRQPAGSDAALHRTNEGGAGGRTGR